MKKLIQSGFIYTLGNLLIRGIGFITLPIYTRIISPEVFGQYNLYLSWIGILSLFISFPTADSLQIARIRLLADEKEYTSYASHALSVSNTIFLLIFIFSFIFRELLASLTGFSVPIFYTLMVQCYFSFLVVFFGYYFIALQKAYVHLILSVIMTIGSTLLSLGLIFHWENDFLARVTGGFIPLSVAAIFILVYIYSKGKTFITPKYLKFTLSVSFPFIFHHLGQNVLNQMDRIMIGRLLSSEDVALYSFGYNIGLIMSLVLFSMNTVWCPWYFEAKKTKLPELYTYIKYYLAFALFLTLGYMTVAPDLTGLLGGAFYKESVSFNGIIVLSYFVSFLYTFPVNVQFYHSNTKIIPVGTLIAGGVNILLNVLLIPLLGIFGAALATIFSYVALLVLHHLISKRLYQYDEVSVKAYLTTSLIAIGYMILMSLFTDYLLIRWGMGLMVIASYFWYFRRELHSVLLLIKNIKKQNNSMTD